MTRRTGLPTIRALALRLCRLVVTYGPIIRAVYPDNTTLHAALDAACDACSLLEQEIYDTIPQGV